MFPTSTSTQLRRYPCCFIYNVEVDSSERISVFGRSQWDLRETISKILEEIYQKRLTSNLKDISFAKRNASQG